MEGYSNQPCVSVCVCVEFSMDGMECKKSEFQRICHGNVLFRRHSNLNGLVMLFHLELLMSTEILRKQSKACYFTIKVTDTCSSYVHITSLAEASAQVSCQHLLV